MTLYRPHPPSFTTDLLFTFLTHRTGRGRTKLQRRPRITFRLRFLPRTDGGSRVDGAWVEACLGTCRRGKGVGVGDLDDDGMDVGGESGTSSGVMALLSLYWEPKIARVS